MAPIMAKIRLRRKRLDDYYVMGVYPSTYLVWSKKCFFRMPKDLSKKLVCKATGFTSENAAIKAVSDTVGSYYSQVDNSSIYTCKKEKECKNSLFISKMEVHLSNNDNYKIVKYVSFKRETVVLSGRPASMNGYTFRQREACGYH